MVVVTKTLVTNATAIVIAENTSEGTSVTSNDDYENQRVLLKNATGGESVFIGSSGVTVANGFPWAVTDGPLEIELEPGEKLYGIVTTATQTVFALKQGR